MSFDNLFRQLNDIQYQADKLLKSKKIDKSSVVKFANYSKDIKNNLIELHLNDELLIHVKDIEEINPNINPKLPVVTTILGALSFGASIKKYRSRKREEYFRENIKNIKDRYAFIDSLLKEI